MRGIVTFMLAHQCQYHMCNVAVISVCLIFAMLGSDLNFNLCLVYYLSTLHFFLVNGMEKNFIFHLLQLVYVFGVCRAYAWKWLVICGWQSCVASEYLERLMLTALHDPSLSQQAAVFHQHQLLRQNAVTTNATCGTAMKSVRAKLLDGSTVLLLIQNTLLLLAICFYIIKFCLGLLSCHFVMIAHPDCPGQYPESRKWFVCVCVCVCVCACVCVSNFILPQAP